jgi:hypothetical protein
MTFIQLFPLPSRENLPAKEFRHPLAPLSAARNHARVPLSKLRTTLYEACATIDGARDLALLSR